MGLLGIGLLIVFSFSRRRGPLRDLPLPVRATPVEFLEALGSLYAEAGASATAVELALERFRRKMGDLCGLKGAKMSADGSGHRAAPAVSPGAAELEKDLAGLRRGRERRPVDAEERAGSWCKRWAAMASTDGCGESEVKSVKREPWPRDSHKRTSLRDI